MDIVQTKSTHSRYEINLHKYYHNRNALCECLLIPLPPTLHNYNVDYLCSWLLSVEPMVVKLNFFSYENSSIMDSVLVATDCPNRFPCYSAQFRHKNTIFAFFIKHSLCLHLTKFYMVNKIYVYFGFPYSPIWIERKLLLLWLLLW